MHLVNYATCPLPTLIAILTWSDPGWAADRGGDEPGEVVPTSLQHQRGVCPHGHQGERVLPIPFLGGVTGEWKIICRYFLVNHKSDLYCILKAVQTTWVILDSMLDTHEILICNLMIFPAVTLHLSHPSGGGVRVRKRNGLPLPRASG